MQNEPRLRNSSASMPNKRIRPERERTLAQAIFQMKRAHALSRAMGEELLQAKAQVAELLVDIKIKDAALDAKVAVHKAEVALLEYKLLSKEAALGLPAPAPAPAPAVGIFGSCGSYIGQFNGPKMMAWDREGNVVVADCVNDRLQVIRLSDGAVLGIIECRCCATATAATYEPSAAKAVEMGSSTVPAPFCSTRAHHRERLLQSSHTGAGVSATISRALRSVNL